MESKVIGGEKVEALLKKMLSQKKKTLVVGVINDGENAQKAQWLEYGWVQRVTPKQRAFFQYNYQIQLGKTLYMPPRPFLRGTYAQNLAKWKSVALNAFKADYSLEQALALAGEVAVADVKQSMISGGIEGGEKFALRSPLTLEIYAKNTKAGKHKVKGTNNSTTSRPLIKSGRLLNAIAFDIEEG